MMDSGMFLSPDIIYLGPNEVAYKEISFLAYQEVRRLLHVLKRS